MSHTPNGLSPPANIPTAVIRPADVSDAFLQLHRLGPTVWFPQGKTRKSVPRAASSHSGSLGSVSLQPSLKSARSRGASCASCSLSLSHRQYVSASDQDTPTTG